MPSERGCFHGASVTLVHRTLSRLAPRQADSARCAYIDVPYAVPVARPLPPEYAGWEALARTLRGQPISALIVAIGGPEPAERLAALTVIDIAGVLPGTLLDWIRTLPDSEANQIAGAVQAAIAGADCREALRWAGFARIGYEQRGLATFLVPLFAALEALEDEGCEERAAAWEGAAGWLCEHGLTLLAREDRAGFDDLSLFAFERYLDRPALFTAFKAMLPTRRELALRVSANPGLYLAGLPERAQREMLEAAEGAGGLPLREAWKLLYEEVTPDA